MPTYTQNYNLEKPGLNETADIEVINNNMDIIDDSLYLHSVDISKHVPYAVTTNVNNAYSATLGLTELTDGQRVQIKCNADSTGNVTFNPDGIGIKNVVKANGTQVTNWKSNGIYTLAYNATTGNFILQGEGGDYGNVLAKHVTQGIIFGTEHGLDVGTNTNKPWTITDLGTITVPGDGQLVFTFDFEPTYVIIIYDTMSGSDKAWINIVLSKNQDLNTTTHGWTAKQKGFITYENATQGSTNTSLINPTFTSNSVMFSRTALSVLNNVRVIAF